MSSFAKLTLSFATVAIFGGVVGVKLASASESVPLYACESPSSCVAGTTECLAQCTPGIGCTCKIW